jgi:excisionase family DNA binding protein
MRDKGNDERLLTLEEAASWSGMGRGTILDAIHFKSLRATRTRKGLCVCEAEMRRWLRTKIRSADAYIEERERQKERDWKAFKQEASAAVRRHKIALAKVRAAELGVPVSPRSAASTRNIETTAAEPSRHWRTVTKKGRKRLYPRQIAALLRERHIIAKTGPLIGDPKKARESLARADAILAKHGIVKAE